MWNLRSLTRDQTHVPCLGKWILNHWTTREVPSLILDQSNQKLFTVIFPLYVISLFSAFLAFSFLLIFSNLITIGLVMIFLCLFTLAFIELSLWIFIKFGMFADFFPSNWFVYPTPFWLSNYTYRRPFESLHNLWDPGHSSSLFGLFSLCTSFCEVSAAVFSRSLIFLLYHKSAINLIKCTFHFRCCFHQ